MCWVMGQTGKFLERAKMVSVGLANPTTKVQRL